MTELKDRSLPCPFCGATPHHGLTKVEYCQLHGEPFQRFRINCPRGCAQIVALTEAMAREKWNTRHNVAAEAALRVTGADELAEALETFAAFADALSEDAPDNIALGLICGGSTHIGPGACTIGGLRKARAALARYKELKNG